MTSGYYARMARPVSLILPLLAAALIGGCGGDSNASKVDFEQTVIAARDDADAGLEQIVQATSFDDLLERLKIAAVEVRAAASDVRTAEAPGELDDERVKLADRLLSLSDEIISTVETFESFPDQAQSTRALNFEQWTAVQASLASLRRQGVDVPALERHKPELQRQ